MKTRNINVSDMLVAIRGLVKAGWRIQASNTYGWSLSHSFMREHRGCFEWLTVTKTY